MASKVRTYKRVAALGVASVLAFTMAQSAFAGECPADQKKSGVRSSSEEKATGVTDDIISTIDLSAKGDAFKGYMMRMRRLVIAPGGIVPWHMHDQRAANILILSGSIEEYNSNCAVPIVHNAGDVVGEFGADVAHWWMNKGSEPVVIISADLLPPQMASDEKM